MKALTICQPYAELIMRGEKRVENRTWPTAYRGPVLIHAGKSREWLLLVDAGLMDEAHEIPLSAMDFGAVVGLAQLEGCVPVAPRRDERKWDPLTLEVWPWLATHQHVEGPWCWILKDVFRFPKPVPWKGQQGLFEIPAAEVAVGLSAAMEARRGKSFKQP